MLGVRPAWARHATWRLLLAVVDVASVDYSSSSTQGGPWVGGTTATAPAATIYGLFTGSSYAMAIPGGWLAERFLGARVAVSAGTLVIALGHGLVAIGAEALFVVGRGRIASGNG